MILCPDKSIIGIDPMKSHLSPGQLQKKVGGSSLTPIRRMVLRTMFQIIKKMRKK